MTGQANATGTGDPAADEILRGLQGLQDASPEEEIEAYRTALDSLAQLLEHQPRLPGLS
ncbi:hypothetical protein [Citricoccus sp. I39-566]|uniref:hypothetical protein n=1 Tax=Citricoccus sp. I39-566 TaxID=3073268 RepID=UPI00286A62B8|nr:hypothetical protein [Citricoccus sp. I39-566]WMY77676.1 hypothetical protein RE421_12675 [Citricoccus sp. I39-566]